MGVAMAEAARRRGLLFSHRDRRSGEDFGGLRQPILRLARLAPDLVEVILGGWADQRGEAGVARAAAAVGVG